MLRGDSTDMEEMRVRQRTQKWIEGTNFEKSSHRSAPRYDRQDVAGSGARILRQQEQPGEISASQRRINELEQQLAMLQWQKAWEGNDG